MRGNSDMAFWLVLIAIFLAPAVFLGLMLRCAYCAIERKPILGTFHGKQS